MAFGIHLNVINITIFLLLLCSIYALEEVKNTGSLKFSWHNCGPVSDPFQLKSISISPDPIVIPGNVTFSASAAVISAIPADIYVSVTMERKVGGFYIKVPCVDNIGSCNYENLCESWSKACTKYFPQWGIPCNCPIPPNTYNVPVTQEHIKGNLPSILDGEFRLTGDLRSASGHIGCLQVEISIKSA